MEPFVFAAPHYLVGLLTLAIPFLLLLTKARSYRRVDFSSVDFLYSITKQASAKIERKRLLLLLVRVTIFLLMALAFSLPYFRSVSGSLFEPRRRLIIVLDRSYRMAYKVGGSDLLSLGKTEVERLIRTARSDTSFSVFAFGEKVETVVAPTRSVETVSQKVRDIPLSDETCDWDTLYSWAAQLPKAPDSVTDFYWFSDFSNFQGTPVEDIKNKLKQALSGGSRLHLVPIHVPSYQNFAIRDIHLGMQPLLYQRSSRIEVSYQHTGFPEGAEKSISLFVNGILMGKKKVKLTDTERGNVNFDIHFPATGTFSIQAMSDPDSLEKDDRRYVIAHVRNPMRILLIDNLPGRRSFESPYVYFVRALESIGESAENTRVEFVVVPPSDLSQGLRESYDMVLCEADAVDRKVAKTLTSFIKLGGSVMLVPGKTGVPGGEDSKELRNFLKGTFDAVQSADVQQGPFAIQRWDEQHPLTKALGAWIRTGFSGVRFFKVTPFHAAGDSGSWNALIRLDHDWPLLLESQRDKGRIFLWTVPFHTQWTDFPIQPAYVPLVNEIVRYAVYGSGADWKDWEVGDQVSNEDFAGGSFERAAVKDPSGQTTNLSWEIVKKPFRLGQAGFYYWGMTLLGHETEQQLMACNLKLGTLIAKPIPIADLGDALRHSESAEEGTPKQNDAIYARNFVYRPLWYAVVLLLFFEAWLGNSFYKAERV